MYQLLLPFPLIITVLFLPMPASLAMLTFTATQKRSDIDLLAVNDVHGLISIVQVIPAWRLMRRVAGPHVTESIRMLGLRTVDSAVCPWTSSSVSSGWIFELVHCCADDGLRKARLLEKSIG
jgi:hypothetical protein